jgi:hypothetical protein
MDSESFLALNQKLHYADIKSKQQTVKMPRTSLEEEPAFHFKTRDTTNKIHECLWIDIPGEAMEQSLSRGTSGWKDYRSLARSTHVLLFLDLGTISVSSNRGPHIEQALDALAYSIQVKIFNGCKLLVAFSKSDAYSKGNQDIIANAKSKIAGRLVDDFGSVEFCELHSLGSEANLQQSMSTIWDWAHSE